MSTLAGARLEEMADIRSTRKKKIVFLCSSIAAACLTYGSIAQSLENNWGLSFFHALCALACLAISYVIKVQRHHQYADLWLSAVLMFEGLLLLLYNDAPSGKMLWLYPIVATLVLINEFKVGLLFSGTYILLILFWGRFFRLTANSHRNHRAEIDADPDSDRVCVSHVLVLLHESPQLHSNTVS